MAENISPFGIVETSPSKFSLLLSDFSPASEVFDEAGIEGGGYAWESVARHIVENVAPELGGRLGFDPEASMFCAYGEDRDALADLGTRLAALFLDRAALTKVIETIGPENFED